MKFYYDEPKQVKFLEDVGDGETVEHYGIAYQDVIICGCCGSIVHADDVIEIITTYSYWVPLEDEIHGE